jgi:hypothetical protein
MRANCLLDGHLAGKIIFMNTSQASQIKAKATQYYAVGIAFFSVIVGIVVTIMVIVNRNS